MNLLFLSPNVRRNCGRSQHVLALLSGLAGRGHRCVLGTNGGDLLDAFEAAGIACEILPLDPEAKGPATTARALWRLGKIVRAGEIDLVHSHHRWPELLAAIRGRVHGWPTVSTCHNLRRGRRWLSYRSDRVIAVSEAVRALLIERFHVDPPRICLIPQAARSIPQPTRAEVVRFQEQCGIGDADRVVVGVGRFHVEKGFDLLLRAAELHGDASPRLRWLLVGDGNERDALARQIAAHGLDVTLVGERQEMGPVYARADVLVMPSREEAMPLVALEASGFRTPVVATAVGGLPEVIRNDETGKLVPPEQPETILKAVRELLADRTLAARCGEQLQALVADRHALPRMVAATEALYTTLVTAR